MNLKKFNNFTTTSKTKLKDLHIDGNFIIIVTNIGQNLNKSQLTL